MNTTTLSNSTSQHEHDKFRTISLTALLSGILQVAAIVIKYLIETGNDPLSFFKYIASGVFGKEALDGGILMITWGLVFHFMIAFLFTAFLFLIYPVVHRLIKSKYVTAILYGALPWAIMNFIVIPLSRISNYSLDMTQAFITATILVFTIGLPIAFMAHRYYTLSGHKK